jgi:hypothetical protein
MTMALFREIEKLYLLQLNFLFLLTLLLAVATYSPRPKPVAPDVVNRYLARDREMLKMWPCQSEILLWR